MGERMDQRMTGEWWENGEGMVRELRGGGLLFARVGTAYKVANVGLCFTRMFSG
jgi:hypothetical protein